MAKSAKRSGEKIARGKRVTDDDALVGQQLRIARLAAGMSQSEVGERIGVTFQQVQKYEKGVNRVSATRLRVLLGMFSVSFDQFFDGTAMATRTAERGTTGLDSPIMIMGSNRQGLRFAKSWVDIKSAKAREALCVLADMAAFSAEDTDEVDAET